jgi:hypothetical protein
MRHFFLFILIVALTASACEHPDRNIHLDPSKPDKYQVNIKIPTAWIEKLRRFDYSRNTKPLLQEFEDLIKPDTVVTSKREHVNSDGSIIAPIFVDLDSQPENELICILGWDDYNPSLCVFKETDGQWYLIYIEGIHTFYSSPTLNIANNFSKNKVFYYRQVDGHGSDVYYDSYNFYKLIDGKVYKCLNLINDNHSYGPESFMSQEIKTTFEFSGDEADNMNVNIDYNFFTNGTDPLIKGENYVNYKWDIKSRTYKLEIFPYQKQLEDLSDQKIACLYNFNDTLFVTAFKNQIDNLLKNGTLQQKQAMRKYLVGVEKDKKLLKQEMVEKTNADGSSYMEPKQKATNL